MKRKLLGKITLGHCDIISLSGEKGRQEGRNTF